MRRISWKYYFISRSVNIDVRFYLYDLFDINYIQLQFDHNTHIFNFFSRHTSHK